MPKVTDEELNGAANALLGLHARDSRPAPSPSPVPPPTQRRLPTSQPNLEHPRSRHGWSTVSPSFAPEHPPRAPVPVLAPEAHILEQQGPPAHPYPFYPKPPPAASSTPYAEQHQHQQPPCYGGSPPAPVSTRQDFLGTPGGGRGGWASQQPTAAATTAAAACGAAAAPSTTPPRRRTEWTPRFGPPMTADPRAVMTVRHAPAVDAWTFLQHQRQHTRNRACRSPSPSHHAGPPSDATTRRMYGSEYQQNVTAGIETRHPARDHYHGYAHAAAAAAAACGGAATTTIGHLPQPYDYAQQQQQQQQYRYQRHARQQPPEQRNERYEQQPAAAAAATVTMPRQEPQQERQQPHPHPHHQHPPQKDVQQQPSINNLWSLIPGTLERQGSSRTGDHNAATTSGSGRARGAPPHSQQQLSRGASCNSDRWFAPDVHLPLSDIARRHRARALARLRARRRALAEAALIPGRPAPVKRRSSETTNEADSSGSDDGGGGGDGSDSDSDSDSQRAHRSKVFLVEGEGGMARVVSGGLTRGVSGGGVVRAVSAGSAAGDTGSGSGNGDDPTALSVGLDVGADGGGRGGAAAAAAGRAATISAAEAISTSSAANPLAVAAAASSYHCHSQAPASHAANAPAGDKGGGGGASKVGDLFELMRNVTMSFGTGGGGSAVEGEENLARELGKPVKYRYRQEAARSRKRTRGRFVSEKAPAFVSITELMALRRAERERQQKGEAAPVPVGAG